MSAQNPTWLRLDNAAKIYPAARSRRWSSMFRLSLSFRDKVDPALLQAALDATLPRFPAIAMRLRRGLFWYYLEQVEEIPTVMPDGPYPCARMSLAEIKRCAFRVLYYKNRVAVEFFHALTDGTGGLIFLKTLAADYLERRYGAGIPCTDGVLDRKESASPEELEDSFLLHEGDVAAGRREAVAYHLRGSKEPDSFLNLTTGIVPLEPVKARAKEKGVSLTTYLAAVMIASILEIQAMRQPNRRRQKPVKVMIPVNLRRFFESRTLRNFALYITPGVDPRMGDYTFDEILGAVHHQMGSELTAKQLSARLTTNVRSEKHPALKIMPLFLKNVGMKLAYRMVGERFSSITISNLGAVRLPEEMCDFVERADFVLGAQAFNPHNCGVVSYDGKLFISIIRNIKEPTLERVFFTKLRRLGVPVKIESNQRDPLCLTVSTAASN